jgi:hypothetical protein
MGRIIVEAKIKFQIVEAIILSILGFTVVISFIMWRLEAITSVNSFEYEFWWLTLITSTLIFIVNIGIFRLIKSKYFPSETKREIKIIPKHERMDKICKWFLTCGGALEAISVIIVCYLLGLFTVNELKAPPLSTILDIITWIVIFGGLLVLIGVIMIFAGALSYFEEEITN